MDKRREHTKKALPADFVTLVETPRKKKSKSSASASTDIVPPKPKKGINSKTNLPVFKILGGQDATHERDERVTIEVLGWLACLAKEDMPGLGPGLKGKKKLGVLREEWGSRLFDHSHPVTGCGPLSGGLWHKPDGQQAMMGWAIKLESDIKHFTNKIPTSHGVGATASGLGDNEVEEHNPVEEALKNLQAAQESFNAEILADSVKKEQSSQKKKSQKNKAEDKEMLGEIVASLVKSSTDFTDQLNSIMSSIPTGVVDDTAVRFCRNDSAANSAAASLIDQDLRSVNAVCRTLGYETLKRLLQDANGNMKPGAVVQFSLLVKNGQRVVLSLKDSKDGRGPYSFKNLLSRKDLRGNSIEFSVALVDRVVVSDADKAKMQKWFG